MDGQGGGAGVRLMVRLRPAGVMVLQMVETFLPHHERV